MCPRLAIGPDHVVLANGGPWISVDFLGLDDLPRAVFLHPMSPGAKCHRNPYKYNTAAHPLGKESGGSFSSFPYLQAISRK